MPRQIIRNGSTMRVFLSYRRSDGSGYAGRLRDALARRLGARNVFHDVTAIRPGEDFTAAVDRSLDACDAVIALIGPGWLSAATSTGEQRLHQVDDFVRLEVGHALARGTPVVPVLVGGAGLPLPEELPDDLGRLARHQAVVLRDDSWQRDVDALVDGLRTGRRHAWQLKRRRTLVAGALVLPVFVAAAWWMLTDVIRREVDAPANFTACESTGDDRWTAVRIPEPAPTAEIPDSAGRLTFALTGAHWRALGPGRWLVIAEGVLDNPTSATIDHGPWRYDALAVGGREFDLSCFSPNPEVVRGGTDSTARIGFEVGCSPDGYMELVDEAMGRVPLTDEEVPTTPCSSVRAQPPLPRDGRRTAHGRTAFAARRRVEEGRWTVASAGGPPWALSPHRPDHPPPRPPRPTRRRRG